MIKRKAHTITNEATNKFGIDTPLFKSRKITIMINVKP